MKSNPHALDLKSEYKKNFAELQEQVMSYIFSARSEDGITVQLIMESIIIPYKDDLLRNLYTNYIIRVLGVFVRDGFLSAMTREVKPIKEQTFYRTPNSFQQQWFRGGYVKLRDISRIKKLELENMTLKGIVSKIMADNQNLQAEVARFRASPGG